MSLRVLQISDCHLVVSGATLVGVDTQASLEAVLAQATQTCQPDAIIASGDIAHDPTRDVYQRFVQTVRRYSAAPLMCLPGNHDVLGVMQVAEVPLAPLELGAWSIVWIDSHEDQLPVSLVTAADRQDVARDLHNAQGKHCLVATHHPMVAINCPWLDKDRIQNAAELIEWLAESSAGVRQASRLRGIVFGHAHQVVEDHCAGLPVYGAPSTCFQFAPGSETFSLGTESPGYRWLDLAEDGSVETQVCRVESYPINVQVNTQE